LVRCSSSLIAHLWSWPSEASCRSRLEISCYSRVTVHPSHASHLLLAGVGRIFTTPHAVSGLTARLPTTFFRALDSEAAPSLSHLAFFLRSRFHSYRRATTGSTFIALRAGT
jgi:hypothetical protein